MPLGSAAWLVQESGSIRYKDFKSAKIVVVNKEIIVEVIEVSEVNEVSDISFANDCAHELLSLTSSEAINFFNFSNFLISSHRVYVVIHLYESEAWVGHDHVLGLAQVLSGKREIDADFQLHHQFADV